MKSRSAFTLVEVMISIALALILVLGISQIFSMAQRTTGTGNAVITALQSARGVGGTLTTDFRTMVNGPSAPALVFYSSAISTWPNSVSKQSDLDGDSGTANDPGGTGTPVQLYFTQVNEQVHRVDRLCFFLRNKFVRQTADAPSLTSNTSSSEAYVWLGHLWIPNNATITSSVNQNGYVSNGCWAPGFGPSFSGSNNDNNFYASSFILGREVILLLPQSTGEKAFVGPPQSNSNPLSLTVPSVSSDGIPLPASRYDLALTSVDQLRTYFSQQYLASAPAPWGGWQDLIGYKGNSVLDPRFIANPYPLKPTTSPPPAGWMSAISAQSAPIFVRGCTQFIVEFAGDFVNQDPATGVVSSAIPDGQVDFTVDPATGAHKIRWYGFPRDPSDEGKIGVFNGVQFGVCPLRDTLLTAPDLKAVYPASAYPNIANASPVERVLPTSSYAANTNYYNTQPAASSSGSKGYVCAWGPDTTTFPRPKMMRITIAIDDPAGHLSGSQTYEYIYNLP